MAGTTTRYFEFVEGSSSKFWEVTLDGSEVRTRYGKIGASGQTTTKDEGSDEAARRLFDKLVAEKTKKGYVEQAAPAAPAAAPVTAGPAPADVAALWDRIASGGDDGRAALGDYLALFGGDADDRRVIAAVVERFSSAQRTGDVLQVVIEDRYDGETMIEFSPPLEGPAPAGVPPSAIAACRVANGASFESAGGGYLGYIGVSDGAFGGSGGWDPSLFEDDEDEVEGLEGAMDHGQNWICFNTKKKNKRGEPVLTFVSHEGGGPETIKKALGLTFGQVWLRIILMQATENDDELDAVST